MNRPIGSVLLVQSIVYDFGFVTDVCPDITMVLQVPLGETSNLLTLRC